MQLQRFSGDAGAIPRDSRMLLGYQCNIHLPIFIRLDSLDVRYLPYKAVTMQLYYGENPTSGHYRNILTGQPPFGKYCQWITDDGCTPLPVTREHASAIYLIWLQQA